MPFPAIGSPLEAFRTYFGEPMAESGVSPEELAAREQSVLDFLAEDLRRAQVTLAAPERAKLEQYTESLRALERELIALPAQSCEPVAPEGDVDNANLSPEVVRAHMDVTSQAIRCGLTHVAHVSILGFEGPHNRYGWLGDGVGHHESHHQGKTETLERIDRFVMGELAHLWSTLVATPEGDGTLADQSVLVYVNTCGGKHHNGQDLHPVISLGTAGGALRTGQQLEWPEKERCISDAFLTLAHAMGVPLDCFGHPDHCRGVLNEVLV